MDIPIKVYCVTSAFIFNGKSATILAATLQIQGNNQSIYLSGFRYLLWISESSAVTGTTCFFFKAWTLFFFSLKAGK